MGNTIKVVVTGTSYEEMEIEVIPYEEEILKIEDDGDEE